jgi:hypothetical protein
MYKIDIPDKSFECEGGGSFEIKSVWATAGAVTVSEDGGV